MRRRLTGVSSRWPSPQAHLVQAFVFLFLVANVFSNRFFISTHRGHEEPSCPKGLGHKIPLALSVHPRQMDRALPLDIPNHLRHRVLGRNRDHHVHVVGQQMPFFDPALLLPAQPPGDFPHVSPQSSVHYLAPTLRTTHIIRTFSGLPPFTIVGTLFFGTSLRIVKRMQDRHGEHRICERPDQTLCSVPCWMFNPECAAFSLEQPVIAAEALSELRDLLTHLQKFSSCDKASVSSPLQEEKHEIPSEVCQPATESSLGRSRADGTSSERTAGTVRRTGRTARECRRSPCDRSSQQKHNGSAHEVTKKPFNLRYHYKILMIE